MAEERVKNKMAKKYLYTKEHQKKGYGKSYDSGIYSKDTWSNRVWQIEKVILSRVLNHRKHLSTLDFACGTGRITEFLERKGFDNIVGIDSSEEMLKEAKKKLKKTKLYCIDVTSDKKNWERFKDKFDTILVFRFFLNASKELRKKVLLFLLGSLKKNGYLVFNIHHNKKSIMFLNDLFDKFYGRKSNHLSVPKIRTLLTKCGFKVFKIYSYGFIPHKRRIKLLPANLWYKIEKRLISEKNLFGTHLLIICKKDERKYGNV